MKHINENLIGDLIEKAKKTSSYEIEEALKKSGLLKRLTLRETAVLLSVEDPCYLKKIFHAASFVKNEIYGKRIVLFAPLYISNICSNYCLYCAFKADNPSIKRKWLNAAEIKEQTKCLLSHGHKRVLMVAGEAAPPHKKLINYYVESIEAIYSASVGSNKIRRVNINCAPLEATEFKKLKTAGIGTYQLFQETYHEETYKKMHPKGPKSDPNNRLDAIDRAFTAGIDDVGIGVLYGLYNYRFETLALLMHIEHLEKKFGVGPHTISVPRINPAQGARVSQNPPFKVSDADFKKIVAVLRLSVPYTGIILSTRETSKMRDELFNYGVSQISAESNTSPGGYLSNESNNQFSLNDNRTLDEITGSLIGRGFVPSFCAACYRKERTGETFMNLAKPGMIKGKCSVNALITLKEYIDDFASEKVKRSGSELIEQLKSTLDNKSIEQFLKFFEETKAGARDKFI